MDKGTAPSSEIEARNSNRVGKDTCVPWIKGHKGIKGNKAADKLCRETSILRRESERADLRTWRKCVRAEAGGGGGGGGG